MLYVINKLKSYDNICITLTENIRLRLPALMSSDSNVILFVAS